MDNELQSDKKSVPFNRTHQAIEAERMLRRIKDDFSDNPDAMDYFYDLYEQVYCKGESLHKAEKVVGTMCVQVPEELIYAAGGVPVRLCNGFYTDDQVGAEFMPAKSCSLVKATLGMLDKRSTLPFVDQVENIILPATCDQKRKAGAMISEMGYKVYDMEVPPVKESEEARLYWRRSVHNFAVSLKEITGKKITKASLKEALAKVAAAQKAYRTLHILRKNAPSIFLGKDAFMVTNAYFFDKIENWTAAVNRLNAELEQRKEKKVTAAQRRAPRILFTGSPAIFPNLKLPVLIEESGGVIVADETCSSNRMLYDMVAVDEYNTENMVASIADNYLKPCTCPIFTRNDDRKRKLLNMARDFAVDGVVYQSFSGCQVYQMEHSSIAKALQDEGVPMLFVESDYSPDDMGQLSTRIEAFIESLKAKRRRKR
ncbi:MAG: 2-hydroxyacyl-CoA dehydratase family protein [Candidatus Polarisedimenticolaceae bacterium]|nr:2-hydroxyacyl-CoA dehydratase family protein [Candidatus Polarisedimenticolaceae bacterium]